MTATLQWDEIAFDLVTPFGTVPFNQPDALGASSALGGLFLLDRGSCRMGAAVRASIEDVPQAPGSIIHRPFKSGYRVVLAAELFRSKDRAACEETLVAMGDLLSGCLDSLLDDGEGRLLWTPTGTDQRMVDDLWLEAEPEISWDGNVAKVTATLVTPFPYATRASETTTAIADGASAVLNNAGTTRFWPVVKAYGAASAFTISNETSGLDLVYDSSLPGASAIGGGAHIEFDFFRNTAYLNGSGANRKAGIDVLASDFWPLERGNNTISVDGASIDVLWQPAYA